MARTPQTTHVEKALQDGDLLAFLGVRCSELRGALRDVMRHLEDGDVREAYMRCVQVGVGR